MTRDQGDPWRNEPKSGFLNRGTASAPGAAPEGFSGDKTQMEALRKLLEMGQADIETGNYTDVVNSSTN